MHDGLQNVASQIDGQGAVWRQKVVLDVAGTSKQASEAVIEALKRLPGSTDTINNAEDSIAAGISAIRTCIAASSVQAHGQAKRGRGQPCELSQLQAPYGRAIRVTAAFECSVSKLALSLDRPRLSRPASLKEPSAVFWPNTCAASFDGCSFCTLYSALRQALHRSHPLRTPVCTSARILHFVAIFYRSVDPKAA